MVSVPTGHATLPEAVGMAVVVTAMIQERAGVGVDATCRGSRTSSRPEIRLSTPELRIMAPGHKKKKS